MINKLSGMTTNELEDILDEAEAQIAQIRNELQGRREADQHEAIDALEFPATRTAVDWSQVKDFFQQVLEDLRQRRNP
ncbi:MAG: hypothetical protein FJX25_05300 [Alphaproteobacteria bacterium]|nr:hypothetical protein [Alphaproteobacteria bacterium]